MKIEILKIQKEDLEKLEIEKWPIWTSEVKKFDWYYDETEICYFIEGKVKVKSQFEEVEIKKGDLVIFPKGLSCQWDVIEPVKKHYSFDDKLAEILLKK